MSEESFTLTDNRTGKKWVLPIIKGTQGPEAIDVRNLYGHVGVFLYDPGYTSTATCDSALTYIDGDIGMMQYAGYPIEQLAEESTFIETAYLLLHGELPSRRQLEVFHRQVMCHTMVHEQIRKFIEGFRRDAHPMAVMIGIVGALSAFYNDETTMDIKNPSHRMLACIRLISKMPTIAAWAYKYTLGQPFVYPDRTKGFAENFLYMMFATPCEPYVVSPVLANALEKVMILHADHEQNQSTSTVRIAGSSLVNPFACIAAGIAALWGPHHGGANEAALRMLEEIGSVDRIPIYLARAKDKNDSFRLMGFGHRVYKNYDPRGKIIKEVCHEVLEHLGKKDEPIFKLAMELEKIALEDPYFVTRRLYPNIDFYSGILLHAMGIPTNMFTVIFAMSRCVGWVSQWKEMVESPEWKLSRPRQVYTGSTRRDYVAADKRKDPAFDEKTIAPKSPCCH